MQNVFDFDPPFVAGAFGNNYDNSLATIKGRFCYVQLKKTILRKPVRVGFSAIVAYGQVGILVCATAHGQKTQNVQR